MPYILRLEETDKSNTTVGGKAANLGELLKAGLPVPAGFVVTTDAYAASMKYARLEEKINSIIENLDVDNQKLLNDGSKEIETFIINHEVPDFVKKAIRDAYDELSFGRGSMMSRQALDMIKVGRDRAFVAVRSSATAEDMEGASFAGQMRSYVNIVGAEKLIEAVKRCWASLYTPRAIFYRKKQNITNIPLIGVIVQKMVDSEKSGVIFTADPTTNRLDRIVIEASWGLGQAIVSGLVTPDEYILDKNTNQLLEKKISKKKLLFRKDQIGKTIMETPTPEKAQSQVLTELEINKLYEYAKKIENWYGGKPQDIEWCIERGKISIVQTRPITTLQKEVLYDKENYGEPILAGSPASPGIAKGKVKIVHSLLELSKIHDGDVLVARMTNPDFVPVMKKAAAIITDEGGRTSHAAIVSRELGVPCIVGTGNATQILKEDQEITIDATVGKVYSGAVEIKQPIETEQIQTDFITATEIKVNLAFPDFPQNIVSKVDGVGLLRAEHILTMQRKHPIYLAKENPEELIKILVDNVGKIAKQFHPKPVWYRSLDARTDEFQNLEGGENEPKEANPMLGWHGIRRSLDQKEILECELEAIKRMHDSGLDNVFLMLPFVINIDELKKTKQMINFHLKTGIMVETPAAVMDLENFCKEGIDFVSIGSNDLTQLTLGIDRGNSNIANLYSEMHPAVLALIKKTVETCKRYGVKSSICGEGPSNMPELVEKLIEFGIDSISVERDAIGKVKNLISRKERQLLLDKIRRENTA